MFYQVEFVRQEPEVMQEFVNEHPVKLIVPFRTHGATDPNCKSTSRKTIYKCTCISEFGRLEIPCGFKYLVSDDGMHVCIPPQRG